MHNFRATVLIVDDEQSNTRIIKKILELEAYRVFTASDGLEALSILQLHRFDMVLTDIRMPNMNGFELLKTLRQVDNHLPVVLITAFGSVEEAVEAMKLGAVDFLTKPITRYNILKVVQNVLKSRISDIKEQQSDLLLGISSQIIDVKRTIRIISPTKASIFLEGESGTGKEVIAGMIHSESKLSGKLVCINCAAIPESLLESELFGYEKGSFTGATGTKIGLFDVANKGTLFLDEVGEMPASIQSKLLRVLQDGTFFRVGGVEARKVEVRIIAATNASMEKAVAEGRFREDLWYRLNVIHLKIPPLREREGDVSILAEYFLNKFSKKYNREKLAFSEDAIQALSDYHWPGNVRELLNVIERTVVLNDVGIINGDHLKLPKQLRKIENLNTEEMQFPVGISLKEMESQVIRKTLHAFGGDKALAAKVLGINLRTIYRKINEGL